RTRRRAAARPRNDRPNRRPAHADSCAVTKVAHAIRTETDARSLSQVAKGGRAMSTPLALATVTAVLQNFIQNSITDHDLAATLGGNITISAAPPDRLDNAASSPDRIKLVPLQPTENQQWPNPSATPLRP